MADVVRSVKARAISATTNAFDRRRAGAPADARTPSESTAFGAVRIACQSGARPASTPVATATATLKPSTFQSMAIVVDTRDECGRGGQDVPDEDRAQTDAGGGAGDGDERAFGEVAQRELAPRRAERDADRRLAGADDGSRQQQRGDVGAGDEQQEAGAAEQDQQRGAEVRRRSDRQLAQVGHARRVEPIAVAGSVAAMMAATRLASACACSSDTPGLRRAYAKYVPLPRFASGGDGSSGIHTSVSPRDIPRLGERKLERRRHDAADRIAALVERDGAADDVAPAAETAPQGRSR